MELFIIVGVVALIALVALFFFKKRKEVEGAVEKEALSPTPAKVEVAPTADVFGRLNKTRDGFVTKLGRLFSTSKERQLAQTEWEELEEALLGGDVGVATTQQLIGNVKKRIDSKSVDLRHLLVEEGVALFSEVKPRVDWEPYHPLVISIVGVNGVGKTTTIGKLASFFKEKNKTVLLGAADTFRAAATEQLKTWAERTESQFVFGREGSDPGAVAFDPLTAAKAREIDVVIIDTAGRLHTKTNLMDELKKVHRVMKKVIPEAPHETWLVLDGSTGQNAVRQAEELKETLDLTGVIVTKLDGTAKGGAVLSIANELKLPVTFVGIGEAVRDLVEFNAQTFVSAILGEARTP